MCYMETAGGKAARVLWIYLWNPHKKILEGSVSKGKSSCLFTIFPNVWIFTMSMPKLRSKNIIFILEIVELFKMYLTFVSTSSEVYL